MESTGSPGTPAPEEGAAPPEFSAPPPPPPDAPPPPTAAPPPPAPASTSPAPASTSPAWLNTIMSSATLAGPAGMVYADIPSRIFAYIIDAIILSIGFFILFSIFGALFFSSIVFGGFGIAALLWLVLLVALYGAGSAIYFIYTWTRMRGSPGQRVLGLETLNAGDGAVLTQSQAVRRWLFLFGPFLIAQVFAISGFLGVLGSLLSFVGLAWAVYLLYTTANSATRQGYHDTSASTVVVKIKR